MIKKIHVVIIGLILVLLLVVIFLQFMADVEAIKKFNITIEKVQVIKMGLFSCELAVTVNFTNPSNRDLSVETATFDVSMADSHLGKNSLSHLSFPSNSTTEQEISLTLLYINIPRVVIEGIQNRNYDISISGEAQVYVLYGLFTVSAPFSLTSTYS
jgi:LEA14-like dessication related protein